MELHKLYKGRYLIALYDKDDMLVDVGISPFDLLTCSVRPHSFYENVSKGRNSIFGYTIHLIDCLEEHDDIFSEEDKIFLDETKSLKKNIAYKKDL